MKSLKCSCCPIKFEASKSWKLWIHILYFLKYLTYIIMLHIKKKLVISQAKRIYIWKYYFLTFQIDFSVTIYRCSHLCTTLCFRSIQEVRVRMLEHFSQRFPKGCTEKYLQKIDLLHVKLKLRGLNYQTPFYEDCVLRYQENCYKNYFWVGNFCNFEVIPKSNISKQIRKVQW